MLSSPRVVMSTWPSSLVTTVGGEHAVGVPSITVREKSVAEVVEAAILVLYAAVNRGRASLLRSGVAAEARRDETMRAESKRGHELYRGRQRPSGS